MAARSNWHGSALAPLPLRGPVRVNPNPFRFLLRCHPPPSAPTLPGPTPTGIVPCQEKKLADSPTQIHILGRPAGFGLAPSERESVLLTGYFRAVNPGGTTDHFRLCHPPPWRSCSLCAALSRNTSSFGISPASRCCLPWVTMCQSPMPWHTTGPSMLGQASATASTLQTS